MNFYKLNQLLSIRILFIYFFQNKKLLSINKSILLTQKTVFFIQIFLNKFGQVELYGLGEATKIVAGVAEVLQRKQYAAIKKIETQTYTPEFGGKKIKLITKLEVKNEGKKLIELDLQKKQPETKQDQNQ